MLRVADRPPNAFAAYLLAYYVVVGGSSERARAGGRADLGFVSLVATARELERSARRYREIRNVDNVETVHASERGVLSNDDVERAYVPTVAVSTQQLIFVASLASESAGCVHEC